MSLRIEVGGRHAKHSTRSGIACVKYAHTRWKMPGKTTRLPLCKTVQNMTLFGYSRHSEGSGTDRTERGAFTYLNRALL